MLASLPMYDWPEVRDATDALWADLARRLGIATPLDRRADYASAWRCPELLFSQTCGYPFTHQFRGQLKYVATPHYDVDGCNGPEYQSIVLARRLAPLADFRDTIAAVNNADSMSGMLALQLVFSSHAVAGRFFSEAVETGGHVNSMLAVRDGRAAVCAIDAVCVALARRYRPDCLDGLVEIARSPFVPSLPFVTRAGDPATLRAALAGMLADPALGSCRDRLFLSGLSIMPERAYDRIPELEDAMTAGGGLSLL